MEEEFHEEESRRRERGVGLKAREKEKDSEGDVFLRVFSIGKLNSSLCSSCFKNINSNKHDAIMKYFVNTKHFSIKN